MLLTVYSFGLLLVLGLGLPYWLLRMVSSGKHREGLSERLGSVPERLQTDRRPAVWVHAVSVGEVLAAGRLVKELGERAPGLRILLSTTTRTGQKLARERIGADRTFYFPLDFAWIVRRYFARLRPVLLVLVETEFWPNLLAECRKASIPVAVINGRISDRSFPRYLRLRGLWRRVLSSLTLVMAQSREDAKRFQAIGVPGSRIVFGGNLKFDVRAVETAAVTVALRANLPKGARVLVCGSTLEREEEILLDAFQQLRKHHPELVMILAPRHPERFQRVAELLRSRGVRCVLRSQWMARPAKLKRGSVVLLDSIGELASVFSLASIAFVGGSLFPEGGHNPLEPAQFAIPIVMGSHYENFRAIVGQLLESEALKLATTETLAPILAMLLSDEEAANLMGVRALEVFDSQAGATDRAVTALLRLLPPATAPIPAAGPGTQQGTQPRPQHRPQR
jgi:3-deoxy-D-manno-octulosonic-acid transferase